MPRQPQQRTPQRRPQHPRKATPNERRHPRRYPYRQASRTRLPTTHPTHRHTYQFLLLILQKQLSGRQRLRHLRHISHRRPTKELTRRSKTQPRLHRLRRHLLHRFLLNNLQTNEHLTRTFHLQTSQPHRPKIKGTHLLSSILRPLLYNSAYHRRTKHVKHPKRTKRKTHLTRRTDRQPTATFAKLSHRLP